MSIDLNLLRDPINRYILAWAGESVGSAVKELERAHGESWWHLVVMLGEGHFAATPFKVLSPLARSQGEEFFYQSLGSLVEALKIPRVLVVEQSEIGTEAAKDLADESPGRVLVITQAGEFLGILYRGEAGAEIEETSLLFLFKEYESTLQKHAEPPGSRDIRTQEQARYIQAQVYESGSGTSPLPNGAPLLADQPYKLDVRISPPDPEWLGPPPEAVFPDDELPESASFHCLQVVFFEPFHAPQPQVQTLQLPRHGASDPVSFNFRTLPDRADFEARIVMLYENRILQTALLRSRVLTPGHPVLAQGESGLHLVIEAVVRNNLSGLEEDQGFGASLVLNHTPAGETSMQAFAGEKALVVSLGGVKPLIDSIKNELGVIYRSPERFDDGLWGRASQELLFRLALSGSQLYDSLLQFQNLADHPVLKESRIQIVTTNVASFLPLEYIYDRQAPRLDPPASLCDNAADALTSGECHCILEDESEAVCPLGFWGLRKVIERFAFERPSGAQTLEGEAFKVFAGLNGSRAELAPFKQVIYAASDKVDEDKDHPNQVQAVLDALQKISGHKTRLVSDWTHWRDGVEQDQPSLLVLLPHNTINPTLHTLHGLEISKGQTRWYTELRRQDVQKEGTNERPVVLLLGCETMSTDIPYESFVAKFLSLGAAIVLGTTTSVLGFHAAPVACKVSEIIQSIIADGTCSFADVMLRLRRQSLLEGYPMVLTLFAYGDAGWKLTPVQQ